MEADATFSLGESVDVRIGECLVTAKVVWGSGTSFGCQFNQPLSKGELSAALLRSSPATYANDSAEEVKASSALIADLSARLRELSRDIDAAERSLREFLKYRDSTITQSERAAARAKPADPPYTAEENADDRLPLAEGAWGIVFLGSLAMWAVLLWLVT